MTIDDRLTRAGQRFRDTHAEAVDVQIAPQTFRPPARAPRPRRRLVGIAVAVCAVVALTVGVGAWVASSGGSPDRVATAGASTSHSPASPTSTSSTAEDLANGPWQLVAADGGGGPITLPAGPLHELLLRFDLATNQVTVSDGCNQITAGLGVNGPTLVLGQTMSTAVGCTEDDAGLRSAVGRVFSGGSVSWRLQGARLTVSRAGATLTYVRADQLSELTGGPWVLSAAETGTGFVSLPDPRPQLQFDRTGHAIGQDGCNSFTVGYRTDGSSFVFSGGASTQKACTDFAIQHAIGGVFGAGSASWALTDSTLTITRDGTTLTYTQA